LDIEDVTKVSFFFLGKKQRNRGYLGQRKCDQGKFLPFREKNKETRDTLDREEVTKE
jgi:hypothetical protein